LFRSATLSNSHYASKWQVCTTENLNDRVAVNNLGVKYATLSAGYEKQDIQLQIIKCFHAYVLKYMNMITKGTLPALNTKAGKECVAFLKTLIPAGSTMKLNKANLTPICKTLHLAFKQLTTDEIYDILSMCLIRAINKYDPEYTDKIIKICKAINETITANNRKRTVPRQEYEFTIEQISTKLGYDCTPYIRLLATKGFIQSIKNTKGRVAGYKRKEWPPKKTFFESGPIAFVYFVPQHFRYYLHEHISKEMSSVEAKEGVFQYEHRTIGSGNSETVSINDAALPGINGNFTDRNGTSWHADLSLAKLQFDVSTMDMAWVKETDDKLFRKLTVNERHILYMVFVQEMTWVDIAAVLDIERATAKKHFVKVMQYLRAKVGKPDITDNK
jgi:hypothetical protein